MNVSAPSPTKHVATACTPPVAAQYTAHVDHAYAMQVDTATINDANAVRVGSWEQGLCGCFSSCVNCCMVWCLPCVSLAQIAQRIGWGKYWHVLLALLGLYFLEIFMSRFVLVTSYSTYWWDYSTYDYDDYRRNYHSGSHWYSSSSSDSYTTTSDFGSTYRSSDDEMLMAFSIGVVLAAVLSVCTFLGSITGLVLIFVTWTLRSRVRTLFNLPGSCCGDCFASFCCSCCAVAQMATHVKTYKQGSCDFGPLDTLPAYLPQ